MADNNLLDLTIDAVRDEEARKRLDRANRATKEGYDAQLATLLRTYFSTPEAAKEWLKGKCELFTDKLWRVLVSSDTLIEELRRHPPADRNNTAP
jgi:ribosome modulation factor